MQRRLRTGLAPQVRGSRIASAAVSLVREPAACSPALTCAMLVRFARNCLIGRFVFSLAPRSQEW
jgi:hypothetical protein